jgi:hypothetical protein
MLRVFAPSVNAALLKPQTNLKTSGTLTSSFFRQVAFFMSHSSCGTCCYSVVEVGLGRAKPLHPDVFTFDPRKKPALGSSRSLCAQAGWLTGVLTPGRGAGSRHGDANIKRVIGPTRCAREDWYPLP